MQTVKVIVYIQQCQFDFLQQQSKYYNASFTSVLVQAIKTDMFFTKHENLGKRFLLENPATNKIEIIRRS